MIQPCLGLAATAAFSLVVPISLAEGGGGRSDGDSKVSRDDFQTGILDHWRVKDGEWAVEDGRVMVRGKFAVMLYGEKERRDFEVSADVGYSAHRGSRRGRPPVPLFRERRHWIRCRPAGNRAQGRTPSLARGSGRSSSFTGWDKGGWKLLQESKVEGCRSGVPGRLKVICKNASFWVYYDDMKTPILTEYDPEFDRAGLIGLWKDQSGAGLFDNFSVGPEPLELAPEPLRINWSWVRGAVYVRSNAVNSVQMWHDYWAHTDLTDRELSYAALYGFNMVQVYLHWIVWDRHREDYLKRIENFLDLADKHGLKVNLILWDDCGHVEPSLTFAAAIPGRHNSQMMTNPSHQLLESEAQTDRLSGSLPEEYVQGVVGKFKDDRRIAFWQLYNECMGPRERYRDGTADANRNRLLGWTREWVKETGTKHPVTATGGGFYGPKYSDFPSYHSYRSGKQPLPNSDGGPEHLNTETLNRPDANLVDCVREFGAKQNGFVVWELMIGRDNCRFPWGHPDGFSEPAEPFHGVVYPDGHPFDLREVQALLGNDGFAALKKKVFEAEYFNGEFTTRKVTSITPRIDFDLEERAWKRVARSLGGGRY